MNNILIILDTNTSKNKNKIIFRLLAFSLRIEKKVIHSSRFIGVDVGKSLSKFTYFIN
jgi:hypothetical protein